MLRLVLSRAAAALLVPILAHAAWAGAPGSAGVDASLCTAAIAEADRATPVPPKLLGAIGLVESGRPDPLTGRVLPWPWTINVQGAGHFFDSKAAAVAATEALLAGGTRSIDVGCMQINLLHHPAAFASLDQAFDPGANVAYAVRFLGQLYRQVNDWPRAAAAYHSQTPELAADYERRVMAAWPLAPRFARALTPSPAMASAIYTPEFARRLAQDTADRAARDAAYRPVRASQLSVLLSRPVGGYTPEFAAERAQAAAERAARLAAMRGEPTAGIQGRHGARQAAAQPRGARPSVRAVAQALN